MPGEKERNTKVLHLTLQSWTTSQQNQVYHFLAMVHVGLCKPQMTHNDCFPHQKESKSKKHDIT